MDPVWALDKLGLSGESEISDEVLRRAYLRKVRAHPPERDPEGFKQVRAAYELLRQHARFLRLALQEHAASRAASAQPVEAPVVAPPHSTASPEPASEAPGPPSTAGEVEGPPDAWQELGGLDVVKKPRRAALLMVQILGATAAGRPLPSPYTCADVALTLLSLGEIERAQRLVAALEGRLAFEGAALALPLAFAARLKLLRELVGLQGRFTEGMIKCLALGVREGDMGAAARTVASEIQHDERLLRVLSTRAPSLYAAVRPYVVQVPRQSRRRDAWPGALGALLFLFFGGLGQLAIPSHAPPSYSQPENAEVAPPAAYHPDPPPVPTPPPGPGSEELRVHAEIENIERDVNAAIETNDCSALLERWATYITTLRSVRPRLVAGTHFMDLQQRAAAMCREQSVVFAETP